MTDISQKGRASFQLFKKGRASPQRSRAPRPAKRPNAEHSIGLHTQDAVHLYEGDVVVVETTVLEEAPELHAVHDERVVGALLVPQGAVELVDLAEVRDVTDHDEDHLTPTTTNQGSYKR